MLQSVQEEVKTYVDEKSEKNKIRTLSHLQALVEETEVPIYDSSEQNLASRNTFMVQAGENTENQGVALLTVPHENIASSNTPGECYSILRLLKNESNAEQNNGQADEPDFDGIDIGEQEGSSRITTQPDGNSVWAQVRRAPRGDVARLPATAMGALQLRRQSLQAMCISCNHLAP